MKGLTTERLNLTMFSLSDAKDLFDYAKNPNVGPHAGWAPHKSIDESKKIIKEIFFPAQSWAIRLKSNNKVIGSIGLEEDRFRPGGNSREMGYSLAEEHWHKGIMTEAASEVLRFAFEEMMLDQVGICTSKVNQRSQRVIEKCGFKYEGTIRRAYKIYDGSMRDSMVFSILKCEWESHRIIQE